MRRIKVFELLICVIFFTIQAMGQLAATTSLAGTVTDASGAVVPNATIAAVDVATRGLGITLSTSTPELYSAGLFGQWRDGFYVSDSITKCLPHLLRSMGTQPF